MEVLYTHRERKKETAPNLEESGDIVEMLCGKSVTVIHEYDTLMSPNYAEVPEICSENTAYDGAL